MTWAGHFDAAVDRAYSRTVPLSRSGLSRLGGFDSCLNEVCG